MRKDKDKIILENGDVLYRYGLEQDYPDVWCNNIHNPEYNFDGLGHKNQIGAYFFYKDENTAKRVLKVAIKKQEAEKGKIVKKATLTTCTVREDIVLLDLFTGIERCSNMVSALRGLELNVVTNSFYNYQKKACYTEIERDLDLLNSENLEEKMDAAQRINNFFYNSLPLLGQSLTDFDNGSVFKEMLICNHWEGYVFKEEETSNTYCLLATTKLTNPVHESLSRESLLSCASDS